MEFYTDKLCAEYALNRTWWAVTLKRSWRLIDNKRVYGWELI
jgi:hypothetical protein